MKLENYETQKVVQGQTVLTPELEEIKVHTFGLCAESIDLEGVCAATPVNFIGTLLYAQLSKFFLTQYHESGFSPHPDFLKPFQVVPQVQVWMRELSSGAWIPTGFTAQQVLIKFICGERVGLVLGSENNRDPLAGLLLRPHRQFPDLSIMRALRLWNDGTVSKKTQPDKLRTADALSRASINRTFELIEFEKRITNMVREAYLAIIDERGAGTTGLKSSQIMQHLLAASDIDADMSYVHMTLWE